MDYDLILRRATLYDGSGVAPIQADLAVRGQTIAAIGDLRADRAPVEIDCSGLALSPGFVNMMSWAPITLIEDGRSLSDIKQGVTLEVFGEAWSEGPLTEKMKAEVKARQGDIQYDIPWTTLGEYLDYMVSRGVSPNITSFVGADTLRLHTVGPDDRHATPTEMAEMKRLLRQGLEEGAIGMSTALIYPPGAYTPATEITELAKVVAEYGGLYASHLRSEGNAFLEALDEFIDTARKSGVRAEVYHLKAMGQANWPKMDAALAKIEAARAEGLPITADMYTYIAAGTGLGASMPPWVQAGGHDAWVARLKDPAVRRRLQVEMTTLTDQWENVYLMSGSADRIILSDFQTAALKPLTGKTLAEVAAARGTDPVDTMIDLVIEDNNNVGITYFVMTEDNLRKQLRKPWVSLCSDAGSLATEGVFLKSGTHPRAYGSFARLLAKYVRDEQVIPLEDAIRRMTSLPAENIRARGRGLLKPGYFADLVVFDPAAIQDNATYANPHQYATGVQHVFVNGAWVLKDGQHTGAKPGQVVRGPGYRA